MNPTLKQKAHRRRVIASVLLLLTVLFTVWVGMGVAMLCNQPDRRSLDTVLILSLIAGSDPDRAAAREWAPLFLREAAV